VTSSMWRASVLFSRSMCDISCRSGGVSEFKSLSVVRVDFDREHGACSIYMYAARELPEAPLSRPRGAAKGGSSRKGRSDFGCGTGGLWSGEEYSCIGVFICMYEIQQSANDLAMSRTHTTCFLSVET
jgi:hypothetical protein